MKWLTLVAATAACCLLGAMVTGLGMAAVRTDGGQSMYRADAVGVLLTAQEMYKAGDAARWAGDLRVEEVKGNGPEVGQTVRIEYTVMAAERLQAPSAGLEVKCTIVRGTGAKGGQVWLAEQMPEGIGRGEMIRPGEGAMTDAGSPGARILVKMFAPLSTECHRDTASMLTELQQRQPERVRVQIYDMRSPQGRREMQREGLTCATVLVNNQYQVTITGPTGERKVAFTHRPNTAQSTYNSADVITYINQEIERLY